MLILLILGIAALAAVVSVSLFGMQLIKSTIEDILEDFR